MESGRGDLGKPVAIWGSQVENCKLNVVFVMVLTSM